MWGGSWRRRPESSRRAQSLLDVAGINYLDMTGNLPVKSADRLAEIIGRAGQGKGRRHAARTGSRAALADSRGFADAGCRLTAQAASFFRGKQTWKR